MALFLFVLVMEVEPRAFLLKCNPSPFLQFEKWSLNSHFVQAELKGGILLPRHPRVLGLHACNSTPLEGDFLRVLPLGWLTPREKQPS